jgi:UDP-glucose 4-epimerase
VKGIVTGAAGFLGSHVADVLAERGSDITVVDLADNPKHHSVRADLMETDQLAAAFAGADFICHLAAVGDVYLAGEKPWLAAQVNATGTANVCEAALKAGVPKVVYASTWEVYGTPQYQPIDERHPCAPDHPYNITKLAGERLALAYGHLRKGLSVSSLRLGTAYGTRMRSNSVFSLFIDKALRGEAITIQGTGQQGRQFTHARDVGRAFALAVEKAKNGDVYNTVADEFVTIRQLAELVTAEIPTKVVYTEARQADVPTATVSNALIKRELGWKPEVPFADGLAEIVAARRASAKTTTPA